MRHLKGERRLINGIGVSMRTQSGGHGICCQAYVYYIIGERAKRRDTLLSVQLRIADILYIMVRANFVLITRKEGGA